MPRLKSLLQLSETQSKTFGPKHTRPFKERAVKEIKLNVRQVRRLIKEAIEQRQPGTPEPYSIVDGSIQEEYLRGVPEFILHQATERYIDEIRKHLTRFIMMNKSEDPRDQRNAISSANDMLETLEEKSNELLEDQLWTFLRNI